MSVKELNEFVDGLITIAKDKQNKMGFVSTNYMELYGYVNALQAVKRFTSLTIVDANVTQDQS